MKKFESTNKFAEEWMEYKKIVIPTQEVILIPTIKKSIKGKQKILCDLGCGDGELTSRLLILDPLSIIGLDINNSLLNIAKSRKINNLLFDYCDLSNDIFPIKENQIEVIISSNLFMHIDDDSLNHTLRECARIMKSACFAYFFVTNFNWAKTHYNLIKDEKFSYHSLRNVWDYNIKEYYRTEDTYKNIFEDNNFKVTDVEHLLIPFDKRLDIRYLSKIGEPLFTKYEVKTQK